MAIKLITFDLDDTLWDVDGLLQRAEEAVFSWLSQHCPPVTQHYSLDSLFQTRVDYWRSHPELKHQISRMRQESLAFILTELGYSSAQATAISRQAFEVFMDYRHRVSYFDHALAVLETLGRDYALGALSNGNACTRRLGIDNYFDFHFSAEQVNASKPDPTLFRAALDHAGISPTQMIHIGDHPKDDIRGAAALGIYTVWINRQGDPWQADDLAPSQTVRCLSELPAAVATIDQIAQGPQNAS